MRLRSLFGFTLIAIGLFALFTPISILQDVGASALRLVETAADNPLSFEAAFMLTVTLGVLVVAALMLMALVDKMKDRQQVVLVGNTVNVDCRYLDIDGVWRRSLGI